MAKIPGNIAYPRRGMAMPGSGYVSERNGEQQFNTWPKPRGKARSKAQQQAQDDFAAAIVIAKNMDPLIQQFAHDLSIGAPILPRDYLMQVLYKRTGYIVMPDGRKVFSVVARQDVSLLLDTIGQTLGSVFYRGNSLWDVVEPGLPGQILTMGVDGVPAWGDAPAVGASEWWLQPPPLDPSGFAAGYGAVAAIAKPIQASGAITLTGVKVIVQPVSTGGTIAPFLYQAAPTTDAYAGGSLVADAPLAAYVNGLNVMPFTSQITLTPGQWYWGGVRINPASTINFAGTLSEAVSAYFDVTGASLPATAPSIHGLNDRGSSWWFY